MSSASSLWENCLRLIRALAVKIHETWLKTHHYLNMEALKQRVKAQLGGLKLTAA